MTACSHPNSVKRLGIKVGNDWKIFDMKRASTYEMMCDSAVVYLPAGSVIVPQFNIDSYGSTVTTGTLSVIIEVTPIFVN